MIWWRRWRRHDRTRVPIDAGTEIHLLMKDTNKKLKVSQGLPDWKAYLDFVNNIIVGGLKKIVVKSCAALEQQLDPVHLAKPTALGPMLEIELDLIDGSVRFIPEVGPGPGELRTIFRDWCMNFDDVRSQRGASMTFLTPSTRLVSISR